MDGDEQGEITGFLLRVVKTGRPHARFLLCGKRRFSFRDA